MTDHEKSGFYRSLAKLRKSLMEVIQPIYVAVGGRTVVGESVDRGNAIATVQAITTVMKVLEAMRTERSTGRARPGPGIPT